MTGMAAARDPLPALWRTKLRSTLPGVDHAAQVDHCVRGRLIGIGWRMDGLGPDTPLDVACKRIEDTAGWGARRHKPSGDSDQMRRSTTSFGRGTPTGATGYARSPAPTATTGAKPPVTLTFIRCVTPHGHHEH